MNSAKGFLLSYLKYGDTDAVLHCFTEQDGYESYFAKNIFSTRSRKKAYLQPLNELQLKYRLKSGSAMHLIWDMEPIHTIENQNIKISTILFFISDFLNNILKNETDQTLIYSEIKLFLVEVEQHNYSSHLFFMIKLLNRLGLSPLISEKKFLDADSGEFSNSQTSTFFTDKISEIWKSILTSDKPYTADLNSEIRAELLDSIMFYYQNHLSNFRRPKSLEIIRQLW